MVICKTMAALEKQLAGTPDFGADRGFVPTMGALHEGHLSLLREAKKNCKIVVVSIFVNPTQFNDPADFAKYPVTLPEDIAMLEPAGCDVLYLPSVADMYPEGIHALEHYPLGRLDELLEGPYRPGHFQGVCQVMDRLLHRVKPGQLFMGAKDYQQCMVVKKLLELKQLPIQMHQCPTLREADGLAMSSRNRRLTPEARQAATAIFAAMKRIHEQKGSQDPRATEKEAGSRLLKAGFDHIDYVSIAHPDTLEPVDQWQTDTPIVVLVAAFIGGVRLIDNLASSDL